MSVDIFGSDSKKRVDDNKQYIDSKFITLAKSLDLSQTRLSLIESVKLDKTGGKLGGEIDMDGYRILNVGGPTNDQAAANKRYVDQKYDSMYYSIMGLLQSMYVPNSIGLIPFLTSRNDKSGYIVEESSRLNEDSAGYNAFRQGSRAWRVGHNVTRDFWIKITLPKQERVYKISMKATDETKIKRWELQGRNIDTDSTESAAPLVQDAFHPWIGIPFTDEENLVVQQSTRFFEVRLQDTNEFRIYRLYVYESEGLNPGLSHLQFYTLNKILYDV